MMTVKSDVILSMSLISVLVLVLTLYALLWVDLIAYAENGQPDSFRYTNCWLKYADTACHCIPHTDEFCLCLP